MNTSRTHLIGLDKPSASPLRTAADPLLALRAQASNHEQHRLESVAEMLALVGVMTVKRVLAGREVVTVQGAVFQWGEGQAEHSSVGAHCLPGQLAFNGQPIHTMQMWTEQFLRERGLKPLALSSKLRNVSARTDVVDRVVNETDSLLEKLGKSRGLKVRFGGAVHQLMERVLFENPRIPGRLIDLVGMAMSYYRLGARYACEERLDWLKQQLPLAASDAKAESRQRGMIVAEQYLRVVQDGSFVPHFASTAGMNELIRDVVGAS
jgi:hypothetical protein